MVKTQADYLIGRFGGVYPAARALGHKNASTVQGWKARGTVPVAQLPALLDAGAALSPPLEHREFVETLDGTPHVIGRTEAA